MAEIKERSPLPQVCQECKELEECRGNTGWCCFDCPHCEERFYVE